MFILCTTLFFGTTPTFFFPAQNRQDVSRSVFAIPPKSHILVKEFPAAGVHRVANQSFTAHTLRDLGRVGIARRHFSLTVSSQQITSSSLPDGAAIVG